MPDAELLFEYNKNQDGLLMMLNKNARRGEK